ncbi:hypothetical protein [Echinicola salinicaeni]|uniref:hypothetical protein n=1 Tax=Echinicola salinicaeni TaxID=2762757 RepID=UPI00164683E5|nr:hypothetical protein [Echinicola salinicaeni]
MNKLFDEIEKFKKWAEDYSDISQDERGGEWECDYSDWPIIWTEFEAFLNDSHYSNWADEEINHILYIIARDNECNSIIEIITEKPETFEFIAEKGLFFNSPNTKWQIAEVLYKLDNKSKAEQLLELYLQQNIEYVSRMAIKSLGLLNSSLTEKYCEQAWNWNQDDPKSEYQRMMALTVLYEFGSPLISQYIKLAKEDGREYLVRQAINIENEMKTNN